MPAACASRCIPGRPRRAGRDPRSCSWRRTWRVCAETLTKRGAKFGKVSEGAFQLCNGKDPDGNPVQLSNR
ncbi:MAG: hypothetical protein WDM81_02860 [Rhizomicrobium sp.]